MLFEIFNDFLDCVVEAIADWTLRVVAFLVNYDLYVLRFNQFAGSGIKVSDFAFWRAAKIKSLRSLKRR